VVKNSLPLEAVAKLHALEKSKILRLVAMDRLADPVTADGGLPRRAGEEAVTQQVSKGRFCEAKSFATGSL
jgi:hypothetical protein